MAIRSDCRQGACLCQAGDERAGPAPTSGPLIRGGRCGRTQWLPAMSATTTPGIYPITWVAKKARHITPLEVEV